MEDKGQIETLKPKVTVISGFLGSGKTTLLNHVLRQAHDERVAVIVNDIGSVNIDAALVNNAVVDVEAPAGGIVSLGGGCVCCSIQTDLIDAVAKLLEKVEPEHIIIEATGAAAPSGILRSLYAPNWYGLNLQEELEVYNLVTVVDVARLWGEISGFRAVPKRRVHVLNSDHRKPIFELLMEQVECSDLLVLNKCDLLQRAQIEKVKAYLAKVNPRAELIETEFAKVSRAELMHKKRFSSDEAKLEANYFRERAPSSSHHHEDYGLSAFTFSSDKLFKESCLLKLLRESTPGLLRAKGFYKTREFPERLGVASLAGNLLRADYLDTEEGVAEEINSRQHLGIIGIDVDEADLSSKLEACLV